MKEVWADIITIGDEILYGQILDTNTRWMAQALSDIGIRVRQKYSVADRPKAIASALDDALKHADVTLMTGGLGPTKDDVTKGTLAEYFHQPLRLHLGVLQTLEERFRSLNRPLNDLNREQAFLPEGCQSLMNERGTAPGIWITAQEKIVVAMPGVPFEMKRMMTTQVLPRLKAGFTLPVLLHQVIRTVGVGESWLAERIATWEANLPENMSLAYLPGKAQVRLRLTGRGAKRVPLQAAMDAEIEKILPTIKAHVYGFGEVALAEAVGKRLMERGLTLAVAESCTGGFLSHQLTSIPGSSAYYLGAIVAYHQEVKIECLQVPTATLSRDGAVSRRVAMAMAANVRRQFKADLGVAVTGVAGPDGGTEEKPVGTVWLALAWGDEIKTQQLSLAGDRRLNIEYAAIKALDFIWRVVGE